MIASLKKILRESQVHTDESEILKYARDWTRVHEPRALGVVFPESTEDVQEIVLWAKQNKIALVPSGGRTGLSAGAVAHSGELVVSMERMNRIFSISEIDRTVHCQAGVVTEVLQEEISKKGYFLPLDLAARGSSQIGGNISTNAGGTKVIRFGHIRDWVRRLKVVTGTGEVLDLHLGLIKDNCGYDLKHLFIAAEGTLGFITEAELEFTNKLKNLSVILLACDDLRRALDILMAFRAIVDLSAFEFFTDKALKHVLRVQDLAAPFQEPHPLYILLEFENTSDAIQDQVLSVFDECVQKGWVKDGVVSQNDQQAENFWRYRENISESLAKHTPYKNDISVAISKIPEFVEAVDQVFTEKFPEFEIVWFGHIGDGNLHINVLKPDSLEISIFKTKTKEISMSLFPVLKKFGGSVSAEHGIGLIKKPFLSFSRTENEISIMKKIKNIFDPESIMNPGKIFD